MSRLKQHVLDLESKKSSDIQKNTGGCSEKAAKEIRARNRREAKELRAHINSNQ